MPVLFRWQFSVLAIAFVSVEIVPGASLNITTLGDDISFGTALGLSSTGTLTVGWRF
jgi:hypothetical protein